MLLQSSDRKVLTECTPSDRQADRQCDRASKKVNVHIPLGVGSGLIDEEESAQKEHGRKKFAEIAAFFHCFWRNIPSRIPLIKTSSR
jgi:hypothetical protein